MLFAEYENVEGQLAFYQTVHAFVTKVLERLRGDEGSHAPSAA